MWKSERWTDDSVSRCACDTEGSMLDTQFHCIHNILWQNSGGFFLCKTVSYNDYIKDFKTYAIITTACLSYLFSRDTTVVSAAHYAAICENLLSVADEMISYQGTRSWFIISYVPSVLQFLVLKVLYYKCTY